MKKHGLLYVNGKIRPEYNVWHSMKRRCLAPSCEAYSNYGGRGISICDRWRDSFKNFFNDMGERPSKYHSLDRIDNDGNYEPSNCRWATKTEQMLNRQNTVVVEYYGEQIHPTELAVRLSVDKDTIYKRIKTGKSLEDGIKRRLKLPYRTTLLGLIKKHFEESSHWDHVFIWGDGKKYGNRWETIKTLSEKLGCSFRSLYNPLKKLNSEKFISIQKAIATRETLIVYEREIQTTAD